MVHRNHSCSFPQGPVVEMGVTTAEKFAGVVIFGDLDEDSLTVLEWVFDYLKIKKDYKLRIIHVVKVGNQDPPETDDGLSQIPLPTSYTHYFTSFVCNFFSSLLFLSS